MFEQLLITQVFTMLMVFCRVGAGMMLLPGFSEAYISTRIRLLFALALSFLLSPIMQPLMPKIPTEIPVLVAFMIGEIIVGLFIGTVARILISTMHIAGTLVAMQTGLGNATLFDATQATQSTSIGNLMSVAAVVLLFAADMHHLLLGAIRDSYQIFTPGLFPNLEDISTHLGSVTNRSFIIATHIAAPFLVINLLLYLGGGVLARLMPNMQVFFIIVSPQLLLSFFILMVAIPSMLMWFMDYYQDSIGQFLAP